MRETVPAALAGERVDRVVAMVTGVSRSRAAELVASGGVRVDDVVVTDRSDRLAEGSVVEVDAPVVEVEDLQPDAAIEVRVVHEDDDVVVVDKPAGLVVHPGAGHRTGTLANGLLARYPEMASVGDPDRPGIVHRIDLGTSGLLAVARSAAGYDGLVAQLSAHTVERAYLALVWGVPEPAAGMVDAPIGRSKRNPTRMAVAADGREARTHYHVEAAFPADDTGTALVRCRLETGRTHQIRVHLQAIGHPVVGDDVYGAARPPLGLDRPFLHATRLGFVHPVTGDALAFDSPLPADLAALVARLRAANESVADTSPSAPEV